MRDTTPPVMLFAAGFGTRMRDLTKGQPKPLVPVAGKALIDHALDLVDDVGAPRVVANLHYLSDMLEHHLRGSGVYTVREEPDILETGGGLRNALPLLKSDTVVTMNTDAIWAGPNPVQILLEKWDPEKMDALLISIPIDHVHGRTSDGDFSLVDDGQLRRGPDMTHNVVYGGVQILKTQGLHAIAETSFSLNLLWNQMAQAGRLFGAHYPGDWCDVGSPEGVLEAEAMLARAHV